MGIVADLKAKREELRESLKDFTAGPMQPAARYQKTGSYDLPEDKIKEKTGIKNGNGSDNVTVDVSRDAPPAPPGPGASIFPPFALWQQSEYLKKLKQWEGKPPDVSASGEPEDLARLNQLGGLDQNGNGGGDPFSGALKSVGSGIKIAGYAIPVMIGVMVLSQVKGLFK